MCDRDNHGLKRIRRPSLAVKDYAETVEVESSSRSNNGKKLRFSVNDEYHVNDLLLAEIPTPEGCMNDRDRNKTVEAKFKYQWPNRAEIPNLSDVIYKLYESYRVQHCVFNIL